MNNRQQDDDILAQNLDLPDDDNGARSPHKPPRDANRFFSRYGRPVIAVITLLVIIGLGVWLWFFLFAEDDSEYAPPDQEAIEQDAEIDTDEDIPAPSGFETIRSSNPRIELTLPEDWEVTEGDDDLRLESPPMNITTADGQTIEDAVFRLYFRQGAREADSQYIGQGTAALPSEQLTYDDPAQGQREETLVSYFGQGATDHISFLFVAGNFELDVGDGLGPDYGQEDETYIIAGGYSSDEFDDDLQMYPVSPDFFRSTNAYEQAINILQSIKLL